MPGAATGLRTGVQVMLSCGLAQGFHVLSYRALQQQWHIDALTSLGPQLWPAFRVGSKLLLPTVSLHHSFFLGPLMASCNFVPLRFHAFCWASTLSTVSTMACVCASTSMLTLSPCVFSPRTVNLRVSGIK